jgi:hypothetical protein
VRTRSGPRKKKKRMTPIMKNAAPPTGERRPPGRPLGTGRPRGRPPKNPRLVPEQSGLRAVTNVNDFDARIDNGLVTEPEQSESAQQTCHDGFQSRYVRREDYHPVYHDQEGVQCDGDGNIHHDIGTILKRMEREKHDGKESKNRERGSNWTDEKENDEEACARHLSKMYEYDASIGQKQLLTRTAFWVIVLTTRSEPSFAWKIPYSLLTNAFLLVLN